MCSLRNMFIHAIVCVVFVRVASEWTHYNGLWYHISDENDTLTYSESKEKCELLHGRLAVLSGWPGDQNKLASFTRSTRRWIHGYPIKVIYESENGYILEHQDTNHTFGYICDWQCQSLGVYPQSLDNLILEDAYKKGDSLYNLTHGVYDLKVGNGVLRQFYIKQPQTYSTHVGIYHNWKWNDTHIWCFKDINHTERYICKISTHFTPYYKDSYPWFPYIDEHIPGSITPSNFITVNFFCRDCKEYEILVSMGSNIMSGTFRRSNTDAELVVFTSSDDDAYLEYDPYDNQWCLTWTPYQKKYCFGYLIAPTVNYTIEYKSLDLDMEISLSCTSTTFPIQQSTVASMESETTVDSNVILAETTAASAISSVTNSQTANTVTDEHGLPTKESRSDDVRSENKTAMYIAIACAIGGVVIIIFISLAVVCCRRRMKNKRKPDTEQSIQNNMRKSKANIYSVGTQSTNYAEIKDSSVVVENKTGKANSEPLYEQAKDPTTENVYSEAEAVDSNIKQMYINGDFVPGSSESQNEAGSHTSDMKTGNNTADDGNDSETEFFNNDIYEGNVNVDRKNTEVPQAVPVKSPSGSDIEMYNNTLYEVSGKGIAQNNMSELVKNVDSVDEDIEMYDNDLYGS